MTVIEKANASGGLDIGLSEMDWMEGGPRAKIPATGVSWNEAARFVNWLNYRTDVVLLGD